MYLFQAQCLETEYTIKYKLLGTEVVAQRKTTISTGPDITS